MGEYARLNRMIQDRQYAKDRCLAAGDFERAAEINVEIGEIKGALLEMADVDGLDDPYEAFD